MNAPRNRLDAAGLLEAVRRSDRLALARAITAIENQTVIGAELAMSVRDTRGLCRTLGVTGPPGAGKSSLINALIRELLPRYPRIGVLTVDPSSPVSGGAVLGDRVRMAAHSANENVFIRSLAARGHLGGVTRTTRAVIDLLGAAGMDLAIVETVGTGQSEVEVATLTDARIAICAPGLGDEMQAIKAGILEVADLLVVNKSDLPDAERTLSHLLSMLHHRGAAEHRRALKVSAMTGEGMESLAAAAEVMLGRIGSKSRETFEGSDDPRLTLADDVGALAAALVRECSSSCMTEMIRQISTGATSRHEAALSALRLLVRSG